MGKYLYTSGDGEKVIEINDFKGKSPKEEPTSYYVTPADEAIEHLVKLQRQHKSILKCWVEVR